MNTLNSSSVLPEIIQGAQDDFSNSKIGIVHFGVGAFHRAHQAVFTHDVLAKDGGDWRILGVSLQSTHIADALNTQDGHYTVVDRSADQTNLRVIKSIARVETAARAKENIFETLASPNIFIVSMTVTEKAYGIIMQSGKVDLDHPAIAHDIHNPDDPIGVVGFIVKGLKLRRAKGLKPFTVLCCDNLPQNGDLVRKGVLDFTLRISEPELANWIENDGAFPNSMVDRITPAPKSKLVDEVSECLRYIDRLPVETESYSQWILENNFAGKRPAWEDVGVLIVDEVEPYEKMKLRMLNGAHSLTAYIGFLSGKAYVRDVMADEEMAQLVMRHIQAAAQTLTPLNGMDFEEYGGQLAQRFANPNIAHETFQIAMDGSQKMPQRIFEPALVSLKRGLSIDPFALATAAWIRFCSGCHDNGDLYTVSDPRSQELAETFTAGNTDASQICDRFCQLNDLVPKDLADSKAWCVAVSNYLELINKDGMYAAIIAISTENT